MWLTVNHSLLMKILLDQSYCTFESQHIYCANSQRGGHQIFHKEPVQICLKRFNMIVIVHQGGQCTSINMKGLSLSSVISNQIWGTEKVEVNQDSTQIESAHS